jgi:hypothetical protein
MINFNSELTQEQARWILEDLIPTDGYRINHQTLSNWAKGHNYAFLEKVGVPGCSCEYIQTFNVWRSRLGQYKPQIEEIAYPPVKTSINEEDIVVEAVTEIQTLPNEIRVKTTRGRKKK